MKRFWLLRFEKPEIITALLVSVASSLCVSVGQKPAPTEAKAIVKADAVGIVFVQPDNQQLISGSGSGVYLGNGIALTNWHIATYAALLLWDEFDLPPEKQLLTHQIGSSSDSLARSWICPVKPGSPPPTPPAKKYFVSPTKASDCVPYNLTQWEVFQPSVQNASVPTVPIKQLLFADRSLELAVVKLNPRDFKATQISPPCLSKRPLTQGQKLTIHSHVSGVYPAARVTATVKDEKPKLLLDPDTRVPVKNRYAAMSIIATVPADQAQKVGPGSSGGPVYDAGGKLVGLVWTAQDLPNGSREVWITPTSVWLSKLQRAKVPDSDLQKVLAAPCPAVGERGR